MRKLIPRDEDLMLAAGKGDLKAFEQIVLRYTRSAWNTAYRFLGQTQEAEDVVQDAFLKIFNAASRYQPTASFSTYFYRVITRLCLDRVRKKQPHFTDAPRETIDPAADPADKLLNRERDQAVCKALEKLSRQQRIVVVLKYYEGLSYRDIANAVNTSEKAVERLLARARRELENDLEDFFKK